VAEHGKPVAVALNASQDPRFQLFKDLPEDKFEAFLSVPVLCRGRIVGVIICKIANRTSIASTKLN